MTNSEYARCIDEAAGLDLDLDCKEIDLQDKFYGLYARGRRCRSGVCVAAKRRSAASAHNADLRSHGAADARGVWSGCGSRIFLPAAGSEIWWRSAEKPSFSSRSKFKNFAEFLGKNELLKMLGEIKSARVQENFDFGEREDELANAVYGASG